MSQVQGTGWCPNCKRQVVTQRQGTNHVLHLILTVLTLGLWAIVWAVVATMNRSKIARCSVCGALAAPLSWKPDAPAAL